MGEDAAHERLLWWRDHVDDYDEKAELSQRRQSSRAFSPHLHFGEISPIQIWHAFKHKRSDGWRTFEGELIWRDYAQNAILQFPAYASKNVPRRISIASAGAIRRPTKPPRVILKPGNRAAPATPSSMPGLRQLWQTGWMHNRVRMITASFLIKHLLIDWREGEEVVRGTRWWMPIYASNATNWQWTAGGRGWIRTCSAGSWRR